MTFSGNYQSSISIFPYRLLVLSVITGESKNVPSSSRKSHLFHFHVITHLIRYLKSDFVLINLPIPSDRSIWGLAYFRQWNITCIFHIINIIFICYCLQTTHLLILFLRLPDFSVCGFGGANCSSSSIVANQKPYDAA